MPDVMSNFEPICAEEFAAWMAACVSEGGEGLTSIAVAVSGGADSMALCLLADEWASLRNIKLHALSVDHGLRRESAAEAAQVGQWLGQRGIAHHILQWREGQERDSAVQARARAARYRLMADWSKAHATRHLLVAHHMEDQAETVLMRLSKGSGLMGLAGMAPSHETEGVTVLRPLLKTSKARLRVTLQTVGQDWIEDPSNRNPVFERVRTRGVLDYLQGDGVTAERLAGVARSCRQVRHVLERAASAVVAQVLDEGQGLKLSAAAFNAAPRPVREVALMQLLARVGGRDYPPAQAKRNRLLDWMEGASQLGRGAKTLSGCEVRLVSRRGEVFFRISSETRRKFIQKAKMSRIYSQTPLAPHA